MKLEDINRKDIHGVYIYIDKTKDIADLKHLNDEFVYYVGLSDSSIINRIHCHSKENHFKDYINKSNVYICPLINSTESASIEKLLINAYKPILNSKDKFDSISITKSMLPELEWYSYDDYDTYMSTYSHKSAKNMQKTKDEKDFVVSYGAFSRYQNLIGDHDTINNCLIGFVKLYLYRKVLIEKNTYNNPYLGISEYEKKELIRFSTFLDNYFKIRPNAYQNYYNNLFLTNGYRFEHKYCTIILPKAENYKDDKYSNTVDTCLGILLDCYRFFSEYWKKIDELYKQIKENII